MCVFTISNFGGGGLVVFEGSIITQLRQVEFQSCIEKIAADQLLGNGLGFAQLDVLE